MVDSTLLSGCTVIRQMHINPIHHKKHEGNSVQGHKLAEYLGLTFDIFDLVNISVYALAGEVGGKLSHKISYYIFTCVV